MAEFFLKSLTAARGLEDKFYIASAATSTEEIGNPIHRGTMGIFKKYGIACTGHRAVRMTAADYGKYDYIIGMDGQNIRNILRIAGGDPEHKVFKLMDFVGGGAGAGACAGRDVADPWYTGDFEATYRDVKEGCEAFLEEMRRRGNV